MYPRRMPRHVLSPHSFAMACLIGLSPLAADGCKDAAKTSEANATQAARDVAKRAVEDVGDVRRGLPAGATELAALYARGADPSKDLPAVRRGLRKIRAEVPDLTRAVSTFFAVADSHGIAIRNDLEQDVMAGQDVWKLFPELEKATSGGVATAVGLFAGARAPGEPDRDWVAATAIHDDHGAVAGVLLTGWTLRRFAFHLQESLRHDLIETQAKTRDPGKLPIVYVAVFDRTGVYSAPQTPPVNEKAVAALDLVSKTAGAPVHGVLSITDRDFGYAAARVPELEADGGVVVLWSEI